MRSFILLLACLATFAASAQMLDPVKFKFDFKPAGGNEFDLIFTATMDKGWTIYSQFTSDDGPVPTVFEFENGAHYARVGKVSESGKKKEGPDPLFDGVNVIKFVTSPVVFTQRVKVTDFSKPIAGYLTFMTCDDERCLPPKDVDFSFSLKQADGAVTTGDSENKTIVSDTSQTANLDDTANFVSPLPSLSIAGECSFKIEGNTIDQTIPAIRETYKNPLGNCGAEDVARDQNLFWTFILGFLGGLVALLTPCVFPMIPLTVSYFTKSSKDRTSGIRNALWYGASIITIYVTIGLLITAFLGPTALNELSTNWIANLLFFIIFLVFAFSFFGYYEITLPSSWSNKTDSMADKGGLIGIFFMAFTLALVSFSCTGPIIGSALVQSATNTLGPFIVMLGFSTALALPFGLFAAFPGWLQSLPKSGGWMNSVKVVLGFLELALALKFLSTADLTMHWGVMPYELFMALWVLCFGLTAAYLFGLFRFPHDGKKAKLSLPRVAFGLLFLLFTGYVATGFRTNEKTGLYATPNLVSGLAPPATYNLLLEPAPLDTEIKKRYPSFSKCANNLDCFKDYCEGLAYAKEVGKPVFIDFTGHGCQNCRKTEDAIWVNQKVWDKLQNEFVLVSLYVDDREKLAETFVSKSQNTKLRNVGNKWADFQIVNFEQNSQPLYVMMTLDEKVMAAPRGFKGTGSADVADYHQFLECGLSTFKDYNTQKLGSN